MGTDKNFALVIIGLGLLSPAQAAAKEPIILAPSSPWHIHQSDDHCRLSRSFGEGDAKVNFTGMKFSEDDALRMSFSGKSLKNRSDGSVKLQFHPHENYRMADYYAATSSDNSPAVVLHFPVRLYDDMEMTKDRTDAMKAGDHNFLSPPMTAEQGAAITHLEFSGRGLPHLHMQFGRMDKVMEKLRECTDEMMTGWGLDMARHKTLQARAQPIGSPGDWVLSRDYPMLLAISGVRGLVNFRLMVDEQGQTSSCHIQQSTRPAEFDALVCKMMMQRAKFQPARDAEGQPMASYYRNTVHFSIPQ